MICKRPPNSSSSSFPLEPYLREINSTRLLSADEEKKLAYRIEEGDAEARDHLVRANLRLVVSIAQGYRGRGLDLQDLIAEGNFGLIRAAEGFDPSRNTRLSTYATFWIKQSIRLGLNNTARTVRLPTYVVQLLVEWHRASAALSEELGRPPEDEEVADRLKLSQRRLRLIKKGIRVQGATTENEDGLSLDEVVADPRAETPGAELEHAEEVQEVLALVDDLEPRDREVLRLRFGLEGAEPMTLKEVGERLDLSRESVRQIERLALHRLSEKLLSA
jgi:RNA polymerase primary sigma factor